MTRDARGQADANDRSGYFAVTAASPALNAKSILARICFGLVVVKVLLQFFNWLVSGGAARVAACSIY